MDDYSALAQRISVSVSGVTGALILSRDGLVLGAYPNEDESLAKAAWLRFTVLGEPEKSFVEFPDQVWAYVRRGPYGAFVLAEVGTRPGVLVDQMEQMLLVAEEGRSRRDTMRLPDAVSAPSGKPRTSLHPAAAKPAPVEVAANVPEPAEQVSAAAGAGADRQEAPLTVAEVPMTAAEEPSRVDATPQPAVGADDASSEAGPAVDPRQGAQEARRIGWRARLRGRCGGRPGAARQRVLGIASGGLRP